MRMCHFLSTDPKMDYVLIGTILGMGNTVCQHKDSRQRAHIKRDNKKNKKNAQYDGTEINLCGDHSDKTQISTGVSKTIITLERFGPHISLRTSTTSESTCNVKFLITCLSASECTLQGYNGVASSSGACNSLNHMRLVKVKMQAHRKSWFTSCDVGQVRVGSGRKSYRIRTRGGMPWKILRVRF